MFSPVHESWWPIFNRLTVDPRFSDIKDAISRTHTKVYPYPDLIFKVFEMPIDEIKVVILGQDPYIKEETFLTESLICPISTPQAMGLSFSVPNGMPIPPSLKNIFKNLFHYHHIDKIPLSGDLTSLTSQGVFLLNSALTVEAGKSNSHQKLWTWFTDEIIREISEKTPDVVFVLWGKNAIEKRRLLKAGTKFVASSHPSPLSDSKPCGMFPPFRDCNFAGGLGIDWSVLSMH